MATAIDPVCGMEVDTTTAAGSSEYQGTTYYFCSPGCKRQFEKDPASFVESPEPDEPQD
jgi:YHS domain-containing protein